MITAFLIVYIGSSLETLVLGDIAPWMGTLPSLPPSFCRHEQHWGYCRPASQCRRPTRTLCGNFGNNSEPAVCCVDHIDPNDIEFSFPGCGDRHVNDTGNDQREMEMNRAFLLNYYRRWSASLYDKDYGKRAMTESNTLMNPDKADVKPPWPWMVTIYIRTRRIHMCGGSLISLRYVLSAAHCSYVDGPIDPRTYKVVLGSASRLNGTVHEVESVTLHPQFTYVQAYNDLSLIRLRKDVTLGSKVMPVCLPTRRLLSRIAPGQVQATVTGWGKTAGKKFYPRDIQETHIAVLTQSDCEAVAKAVPFSLLPQGITEILLCAGDKIRGNDTCTGDSGGPLVMELTNSIYVQLGIVSFGFGCELPEYPGVYTKVSHFIDWIYANSDLYKHYNYY